MLESVAIIVAIIGTGFAVLIGMGAIVITLFLWARSESRQDAKAASDQITAIRELVNSIQQEMKDFHRELCSLKKDIEKSP